MHLGITKPKTKITTKKVDKPHISIEAQGAPVGKPTRMGGSVCETSSVEYILDVQMLDETKGTRIVHLYIMDMYSKNIELLLQLRTLTSEDQLHIHLCGEDYSTTPMLELISTLEVKKIVYVERVSTIAQLTYILHCDSIVASETLFMNFSGKEKYAVGTDVDMKDMLHRSAYTVNYYYEFLKQSGCLTEEDIISLRDKNVTFLKVGDEAVELLLTSLKRVDQLGLKTVNSVVVENISKLEE